MTLFFKSNLDKLATYFACQVPENAMMLNKNQQSRLELYIIYV